MKESLMERNMEIHQLEDLYSPIIQTKPKPPVEIVETAMKKIPHDENHPLWQVNNSAVKQNIYTKSSRKNLLIPTEIELGFQKIAKSNLHQH